MAIRTVGPNGAYVSIAAAMADAGPGDTIQLEPGYSNETATILYSGMIISGEASSTGIILNLGQGIATVTLSGTAPIELNDATDGNDIVGNDGNNLITVIGGADAASGGAGDDRLFVDYRLATGAVTGTTANVAEAGGGGRLVTNNGGFEHFTIWTGAGADTITTGAGNDDIRTGEGAGTVTAGEGFNTIIGGSGADTITAGDGGNYVDGGDGANIITTGGGEDEVLTGTGDDTVVSSGGDDRITITGGADSADAGDGSDLLIVDYSASLTDVTGGVTSGGAAAGYSGHIADLAGATLDFVGVERMDVTTGSGNDSVKTGGGEDRIQAGAGNDTLNGGAGADTLLGELGDDIYVVDQAGDVVIEAAGEGTDMLVAKASYVLGTGVSIDTMTTINAAATTAINLTGNELGQSLYGNAGDNILTGLGGSDYLVGEAGNDQYYVDTSDFIAEAVGGGDDTVLVADTYFLRDGIEIETLVAVNQASLDPVNLSGNEFGQSLYGSEGVNSLNGGAGNDYLVGLGGNDFLLGGGGDDNMAGGQGNDIYYVDAAADRVIEAAGEGDDLAVAFASFALEAGSSVETLSAAGSSAINLTGNALAQSLYGNAGANVLTSGGGADYMVGGGGNDVFVLSNAAITSPGPANIAGIGDYASGDVVDISQILSVGAGTNVISGGYLRISASGQLQVDLDGGGNNYVTVGNVNGSGNVTVRYVAGGSATDLSVARSASQSALVSKIASTGQSDMMAGAVAAAGIAAFVPTASTPEAASDHSALSAPSVAATSFDVTPDLALAGDASGTLPARTSLDGNENAAAMSKAGTVVQADWSPQLHAIAPQGGTAPTALDQGTELAAAPAPASYALIAHGIAMPAAELAAQVDGTAVADTAPQHALIGQVLFEALAGGTSHGPIDALFNALPASVGHAAISGIDHLAQLASFHATFGPEAAFHTAFAVETIVMHPDAPAVA